ncbi:MAG: Flp family type IVb pilin [Planctomycetota bacterium]
MKRFVNDERGLETVEYAIILGLIVAATILLITQLGGWVVAAFRRVLVAVGETPAA